MFHEQDEQWIEESPDYQIDSFSGFRDDSLFPQYFICIALPAQDFIHAALKVPDVSLLFEQPCDEWESQRADYPIIGRKRGLKTVENFFCGR